MASVLCPLCGQRNSEFNLFCSACSGPLTHDSGAAATPPRSALTTVVGVSSGAGGSAAQLDELTGRTIAHYEVLERIGQGGRGVVYRALDTRLRRPVALKFLAPQIAHEPLARARFEREARAASALDHPNIATVYEIGEHHGQLYIAMAFYEGETLQQRLNRGPLELEEARPIVNQLASGLAAAHAAGIVHRDLKPANVILSSSEQLRILDFGLAKQVSDIDSPASDPLTADGQVLGTFAYMAPEQFTGAEVTAAADLYALGVVLYEMVTGRRPFTGDAATVLARRLSEEPPPPRLYAPTLEPRWEAAILRCLEREPSQRFASAGDVAQALRGEPVQGARSLHKGPRRRWLVLASLAAALLATGAVGYRLRATDVGLEPGGPRVTAGQPRRSVAVLGFKNLSGRPEVAWLSTALSEMLSAELAAGEKLHIIPGESVARAKIELKLSEAESYAPDTLERIRKNLGTDLVILGSYVSLAEKAGGKLNLVLRLQDTTSGESLASISDAGAESELFELVSRAGAELRRKLRAGERSKAEEERVRAALPSDPAAAQLYAAGLEKLRLFDASAARELLGKAAAIEPEHPLVHWAMAQALDELGDQEQAKREAKKAFDLSGHLSREDQLLVEAHYRESLNEWERAAELYRTLFTFFSDRLDYGLMLCRAQRISNQAGRALETIEALRKLPAPVAEDPRIDIEEAWAALFVRDLPRAQEAAARAARRAQTREAWLQVANARHTEAWIAQYTADLDRAAAGFEESRRIYAVTGHRLSAAVSLFGLANVSVEQGDLARARTMYEEYLSTSHEVGCRSCVCAALNALGQFPYLQGELNKAKAMYEEALSSCQDTGDQYMVTEVQDNMSGVQYALGDLHGAQKTSEQVLSRRRERGVDPGVAIYRLGEILLAQGDLAGARSRFEELLRHKSVAWSEFLRAWANGPLARLALEEGNPAQAEALSREIVDTWRRAKSSDAEALGRAMLAEALLAQRKLAEAQVEVGQTAARSDQSRPFAVRLALAITNARVHAASDGKSGLEEARRSLEAVLSDAATAGHVPLELEAWLALGEIEMASGQREAGGARLEALERKAREKGFGLIARKAAQSLR